MNIRTRTSWVFALYLALYLCLLAPLHLLHLGADFQSVDRLSQSCTDESRQTRHNSNSCPACQLGGGLIDLPTHHDFSSVLTPVSALSEHGSLSVSTGESCRPSPRAPPLCG